MSWWGRKEYEWERKEYEGGNAELQLDEEWQEVKEIVALLPRRKRAELMMSLKLVVGGNQETPPPLS